MLFFFLFFGTLSFLRQSKWEDVSIIICFLFFFLGGGGGGDGDDVGVDVLRIFSLGDFGVVCLLKRRM